jgi:predicted nucleic-acid-binding protein
MIGLDTNIVIRYLVQDDPEQSKIASRIFEKELSPKNKGNICIIVLCEIVWVLVRCYKQKKEKIAEVIRTLLVADTIEVDSRDAVWKALRAFECGEADFSDYLIAHIHNEHGAAFTLTFDHNAATCPLFKLAK